MTKKTPTRTKTSQLDDFLCFAVYSTNLAFSRVYKPVLEELGITYPQYITLIALWEEDDHTVKSLSERLFLEPSTMTPMLKRLEAMGYVTRTRDTQDERNVRIALTEAGRAVREKGFGHAGGTMKATGLTVEEFPVLQKAVANLRDNLVKASKGEA
jgi:DNA-binding MarR family transcriptional regulator